MGNKNGIESIPVLHYVCGTIQVLCGVVCAMKKSGCVTSPATGSYSSS